MFIGRRSQRYEQHDAVSSSYVCVHGDEEMKDRQDVNNGGYEEEEEGRKLMTTKRRVMKMMTILTERSHIKVVKGELSGGGAQSSDRDTGLLDHLLKQLANKVVPGGDLRFRRSHNAVGAMEHWLQSADLLKIRKDAGVN
ncbi:unnamed protein product [Lactuca virosa]|uniref:PTC1-like winged helix-turn-helix domain-containing protein n=1 Tax=Lactuca virosa TaxID=75947 RepID=A0AAU9MY64_9ASTR|nr:unnamed protein product [Lactuca virosa]